MKNKTTILFLVLGLFTGPWGWAAEQEFTPQDYEKDTQEVKELMNTTEVDSRYNYCIEGTLTCRSLVLLKSKANGARVESWVDIFTSSERMVGSTGYFLVNENRRFRAVTDQTMDGLINIDLKFGDNQNLRITFDQQNFPTVHGVSVKRLGAEAYLYGKIIFSAEEAKIVGILIEPKKPENNKPVKIVYKRVR